MGNEYKDSRLQNLRVKLNESKRKTPNIDDASSLRRSVRPSRTDRKTGLPHLQSAFFGDHNTLTSEHQQEVKKVPEMRNFSVVPRRLAQEYSQSHEKQQETQSKKSDSLRSVLTRNSKFVDTLEGFEVVKKLGKGAYAKVYLIRNPRDGREFAMKSYSKKEYLTKPQRFINIRSEVDIMSKVNHNSIIKLEHVCETSEKVASFDSDPSLDGKGWFLQFRRILGSSE